MFDCEGAGIHCANIDEAWEHWFSVITQRDSTETAASRDGDVVGEVLNAVTVIDDPTRCILRSKIRNLPMR